MATRRSFPISLLALCATVAAAAGTPGVPAAGPARNRTDVWRLGPLLDAASPAAGPAVDCEPGIRHLRLYCLPAGLDRAKLVAAATALFDLQWGSHSGGGLWLKGGALRSRRAEQLRVSGRELGRRRLRSRIEALKRLGRPDAAETQLSASDRDWLRREGALLAGLFEALTAGDVNILLQSGVWVSGEVTRSPALSRVARRVANSGTLTFTRVNRHGQLVEQFSEQPGLRDIDRTRLCLATYGNRESPGIRLGLLRPEQEIGPAPSRTTLTISKTVPDPVRVLLPPEPAPGRCLGGSEAIELQQPARFPTPGSPQGLTYPELLMALHRSTGLPLFSDVYLRPRIVAGLREPISGAMTGRTLLDHIAREFSCDWWVHRGAIYLRHPQWYYEELREVPVSVENSFHRRLAREGSLTVAHRVSLARQVTAEQFYRLCVEYQDLMPLRRDWAASFMLASMAADGLRAASRTARVGFGSMNPSQRKAFLRVTRSEAPYFLAEPDRDEKLWGVVVRRRESGPPAWDVSYLWDARAYLAVPVADTWPVNVNRRGRMTRELLEERDRVQ